MSLGMALSSLALGISFVVSAVKFIDWLLHSEPRAIIRVGRWLLLALAATSVPSLVALLAFQQWTMAMLLGAGMLAAPVLLTWRALAPRAKFGPVWTADNPRDGARGDFGRPPPDPELVRRAAIVLEDYLLHAGQLEAGTREGRQPPTKRQAMELQSSGPMDAEEALAVLGLEADTSAAAVRAAHRRLLQLIHPDRGGSNYLAGKINTAKEVLLASVRGKPHASTRSGSRSPSNRAASLDA